ncbi:MAG: response regulator [Treponema sp.]|jgi:CheY-like chemotaxis protein|nr:response regulator [Treponema sp.]
MPEQTAKKIILAVDDMPVNLAIIRNILCTDYDLRPLKSAKTALRLMDTLRPDLIILDVEMPEMSGLEFFNLIRSNPSHPEQKDIPVIFVSSHEVETIVAGAGNGGIQDYLVKPVDPATLLQKINSLLNTERTSSRD